MTEQEAETIAAIIATADGECLYCAADLACRLDSADLGSFDWFALVASGTRWSPEKVREAACGDGG